MKKERLETINFFGLYTWLFLISITLSLYFFKPELFEPQRIRQFFSDNLISGLFVYFIISTLRGFTLIPSTPIVLAGILVFPPWPLFLVNQLAVLSSSAILYYMVRYIRMDGFFNSRYPRYIDTLKRWLHRKELPVITVWGFAPFVPTDMIVYVCSVLRIHIAKTLFGVSIGEGVICALYIFGGAAGVNYLLEFFQAS